MKASFTHRLQYAALRVMVALLSLVPWTVAGAAGAALGRLGYWPLRIRRRVVEKQIADSFPGLPAEERRAIARSAYANLGRVGIETALGARLDQQRILDIFDTPVGWEHFERPASRGQGIILVSGHLGNWEIGAAYLAARGLDVTAVVRGQSNKLFEDFANRSRRRLGWNTIWDGEATRGIPRAIRDGRVVALLADQGVMGLSSIWVPFFGRPARTPQGPAVFALRLGAPCVVSVVTRQPDGRYRLFADSVDVIDTGNRERDVEAIVAAYTRRFEAWVREYPGQYLWQHRRWRHRPDGSSDD